MQFKSKMIHNEIFIFVVAIYYNIVKFSLFELDKEKIHLNNR